MKKVKDAKDVIVVGAGGNGRVTSEIIAAAGDHFVGFLDDNPSMNVLGCVRDFEKFLDCCFIVAIGNAEIRERIVNMMAGVEWYTAIHPSAIISPTATVGLGTAVMPNAVIHTGASVGNHCIINTGAIVEHDNRIEDYVHISVGAKLGGTVRVGKASWIGIGATISNNISVCGGCMVGAGSVVVRDLTYPAIYKGVPAREE